MRIKRSKVCLLFSFHYNLCVSIEPCPENLNIRCKNSNWFWRWIIGTVRMFQSCNVDGLLVCIGYATRIHTDNIHLQSSLPDYICIIISWGYAVWDNLGLVGSINFHPVWDKILWNCLGLGGSLYFRSVSFKWEKITSSTILEAYTSTQYRII